jgi:hypothetical protein
LTDRLVASINDYYFLTFQNTEIQSKTLNNVLSFVFHYFVEDNVSIAASYTWNYADSKNYSNIMAESENNYNNVSIGINYYIDRGIIVH